MSNEHGPARALVERILHLDLANVGEIRAAADALDAQIDAAQTWPTIIKSKAEYEAAMSRIDALMEANPEPNTPDDNQLELLAVLVEDYERQHYPIAPQWPTGDEAAAKLALEWHVQETAYFHAQAHGIADYSKMSHEVIAAAVLARLNGEGNDV